MTNRALKILICDDHEVVREGIKHILLKGGIVSRVGGAADAREAMEAVRREKWDVVILDINLGGRNGMEVLKEIKAEFPLLPVLMLSIYPEAQFALRAIRAGASGYLKKNLTLDMLHDAIRQVAGGGQYTSPVVAGQLLDAVRYPDSLPLHTTLSDREDQVLRMIGAGRTVGEIAQMLHLSAKTVSTYRAITLRKLSLKNNAQLMRYALEYELEE